MTTHALMELAAHIALLTNVRDASKANGGVRSIDFGKASGDAFIAALTSAIEALKLRTAAAEGGELERFLIRTLLMHMVIDDDRNDVFSHWKGERRSVKEMATEYLGDRK